MNTRKTVYHSGLMSPTRITVESDAMKSKYAEKKSLKPSDPGYYYMFIKIDGTDHILNIENETIAKSLEAYKGQGEITIQAEGREEQAVIKILKPDGTSEVAQPPAQTAPPTSSGNGLADFQSQLRRMANAMIEIKRTVKQGQDQIEKELGIKATPEQFHAESTTFFINLNPSRRDTDYIGHLPEA